MANLNKTVINGACETNVIGANEFAANSLRQMNAFQHINEFIDVKFRFEGSQECIFAHRVVLAAASPYFRTLFNTAESKEPEMEILHIDCSIFELLVNFCYTGVLKPDKRCVRELLEGASELQLDGAIQECTNFLISELTCETFRNIEAFAYKNKCMLLQQAAIEFGAMHFRELIQHKEFLELCPFALLELIEHEELDMMPEAEIFDAVLLWFKHNPAERSQHIANIIGSLHLTELEPTFILKFVKPLPGCEQLALQAVDWHLVAERRAESPLKYTAPRTCLIAVQVNRDTDKSILQYDAAQKRWLLLREFSFMRRFFNVIYHKNCLLFIGGRNYDDRKASNCVDCFNLRLLRWESWPPMHFSRSEFCAVKLNGHIYVMGGCGDNSKAALNTVEVFDLLTHKWRLVAPMTTCRRCAKAVALENHIYVCGGFSCNGILNSVECYYPEDDTWESQSSMSFSRGLHGLAVANGFIYALSGWGICGHTASVEYFDSKQNEWTELCSFTLARKQICAVSFHDQLMAIGGVVNNEALDIVEEYDVLKNEWRRLSELPKAGEYSCIFIPSILVDKLKKIEIFCGCGDGEKDR